MAADNSTGYSPTQTEASCPFDARGGTDHAPLWEGSTTHRRTESGRGQDPAPHDNGQVDHGAVAALGSTGTAAVNVEQASRLGETALPQMGAGIVGTSPADSAITDSAITDSAITSGRDVAVPGVVAIEDRADFLAGWAAGQAAAAACGPLPDEVARDTVMILDTITPAPVPPRRPRGGVRDAG